MAQSRTAKKAIRQNERHRIRNKAATSHMRTQIKRVHAAIEANDGSAPAELATAQKLIDKAAKNNRMHAKKAARLKSQLARAANAK